MRGYDYDIAVIGGGAAGLTAVFTANGVGKKVILIEKDKLGGECTWSGCVPSKALIKAGKVAYQSQDTAKYGIKTDCKVNTTKVMDYVHSIQKQIYQEECLQVLQEAGIEFLADKAEFIDRHTLQVGREKITANKIIIATGSSPLVPAIEGIEDISYLTNQNFFELNSLPESLLIIGGGPIGVEMAQALNRLGVEVTLVERSNRILKKEEPALSEILAEKLSQEGVNLLTAHQAVRVEQGDKLRLIVHDGDQEQMLTAESLLLAAGRRANIKGFNLSSLGVKTGQQRITTDKKMQTNISNIYACGDVVGPYRFSHISYHEAIVAVINAISPLPIKKMDYNNLLWVTYTDPELAHLGLTEGQAREKYGDKIKVYQLDYSQLDRAMTDSEQGQAKFICDRKGKLLGAHILGARAGEIIHSCQIIKSLDLPFKKLQSIIHAYPTYSELIRDGSKMAYIADWENKFEFLSQLLWWK